MKMGRSTEYSKEFKDDEKGDGSEENQTLHEFIHCCTCVNMGEWWCQRTLNHIREIKG